MNGSTGIRALDLPDEILSLICLELARDRDFGTLYACALTGSILADPALRTMYQSHELSPSFLQSDEIDVRQRTVDYATKAAEANQAFVRWTILWRSIILSGVDGSRTYRPYCRYLRMLDFRNLTAMLEDYKFTGPVLRTFFANGLSSFHFPKREYKRQTVDVVATINAVGEAITQKTILLEEIAGHLSPGFLPNWIARSPKLETMVLWKGDALINEAGAAIATNCENFRNLTVREWRSPTADLTCSNFFNELRPDSMEYFEMISFNDIGPSSFEALSRHKSLRELILGNLTHEAVQHLNRLKGCTELHTLVLEDNTGAVQLESLNNDVFVEVVQWLSSCSKLKDLTLKRFYDGPAILSQVLLSPIVKLTKLSVEGYVVNKQSSRLFHSAISDQKSLESVWLRGNGEETVPDDLKIMVEGLSNLGNLRELILKDVSDEFAEEHIMTLAVSLPLLEDFWTSGGEVSGNVLCALANLKQLKSLTLYAMTKFTLDEIIDFLQNLDPEAQKGFQLSLMAADPDEGNLSEVEQDVVRDFIRANLDGRFDFVLWREAETSDSEDD